MGSLSYRNPGQDCRTVPSNNCATPDTTPKTERGARRKSAACVDEGRCPYRSDRELVSFQGQVCEIYIYIYTTPDNHPCCQSTGAGECISSCHVVFEQAKTWDIAIGRGRESGIIIPFQVPAGGPTCPVPWHAMPRYGGPTLSPTQSQAIHSL